MLEWLWPTTVAASADRHTYFRRCAILESILHLASTRPTHAERRLAIREAAFSR